MGGRPSCRRAMASCSTPSRSRTACSSCARSAAVARVTHHDRGGREIGEIALPELCSVVGIDGTRDEPLAFLQIEGFTRPGQPLPVGGRDHASRPTARTEGDVGVRDHVRGDARAYPSADGTEVGLFTGAPRRRSLPTTTRRASSPATAGSPSPRRPAWSPTIAAWAEAGGLFAVAGLRGGYEQGEEWHQAGRREHKQNVFDDFHAAADHLVATRRTARDRLAIRGGSNGGLLVGAALTQRPDLCRAVHCAVPLLDMVRYPQFLIARLWTDEYGDPDVAEELDWLLGYSPYHHVRDGVCYPAVLLTTAEGDSRVDPAPRPQDGGVAADGHAPARTSDRSCCTRRAAPVTARASRCTSRRTSWPTSSRSSPGSSAWTQACDAVGRAACLRRSGRVAGSGRAARRRRPGLAGIGAAAGRPHARAAGGAIVGARSGIGSGRRRDRHRHRRRRAADRRRPGAIRSDPAGRGRRRSVSPGSTTSSSSPRISIARSRPWRTGSASRCCAPAMARPVGRRCVKPSSGWARWSSRWCRPSRRSRVGTVRRASTAWRSP